MTSYPLFDFLQQYHHLWLIGASVLSVLVGSFLNVVIVRLPKAMYEEWEQECQALLHASAQDQSPSRSALGALTWPASHCPACQNPLKAWHNIPLVSYILLRGQCAFCSIKISPRYPLVELLTGALGLLVAWQLGPGIAALLALVWVYALVALTFIDLEHKLLPDSLTLPLMWLGLVANSLGFFTSLHAALWGAVAGYLSLWLIYWGFRLVTGRHGMGYGDFKLLAALGAWLGWQALPIIVMVSAVAGIVVALALRLRATQTDPQMPFGPFLSAGGLVYLLWGEQLWLIFEPF